MRSGSRSSPVTRSSISSRSMSRPVGESSPVGSRHADTACAASAPRHAVSHLREMVLEVRDVVAHEVIERRGLVGRIELPAELIHVVARVLAVAHVGGHGVHNANEVPVVRLPQRDDLGPRRRRVPLQADPIVLRVAREHEVVLAVRAHEALMVVRRRVDEMANDLLRGPCAGFRPPRHRRLRQSLEPWRGVVDGAFEVANEIGGGEVRRIRGHGMVHGRSVGA